MTNFSTSWMTGAEEQKLPATQLVHQEAEIVLLIIGLFLVILGLGMSIPAGIDAVAHNDDWQVFAICSAFVTFCGGMLFLANRGDHSEITFRQGFLITVCTWIAIPLFGALPFVYSDLNLSYTDAFFEAMSGVTTTGSTVISGLDGLPPGILLWRSLLQWFGGVGIIVMGVALLPMLKVGGMQLFKVEAFDVSENFIPRSTKLAASLSFLYIALTLICALVLWLAGMTPFEAACHAFTTLSTGGFSTSDASVGHFNSAVIDYVISFFMVMGSLPFILYLKVLKGHPMGLMGDSQVRGFLITVAGIIGFLTLWLWLGGRFDLDGALRYTTFNVISVITGTGFASTDYTTWGMLSIAVFFFIMFIGGCAGSTSCGIKIFRFQIMFRVVRSQLRQLLWPNRINAVSYNNRPVSSSAIGSVFAFVFLYLICVMLLTTALTMTGLDFVSALSGAGTAMSNVGPGVGQLIGPAGNFHDLPNSAKWLLSFGMLLGRLELFAVLVLFSPRFWRS